MSRENFDKYIAIYFKKTNEIVKKFKPENKICLQFFQRQNNMLFCGINEVLELLINNTDLDKYTIKYLPEGSIINSKEVVLELEGNYQEFGHLEGIIDGILSRATSLATNAKRVKDAANGKTVIFMGDRADHYLNQSRDGYAINMGGINIQVTDAQVSLHGGKAVGTVPHALIQIFDGNLIESLRAYSQVYPDEKLTALVDFNNDVIGDSLLALNEFKDKLGAVRVDTSISMRDKMFINNEEEWGVTPNQIKKLRNALNENNGSHVKIIVSSGFDEDKIKLFENEQTPVDYYGVGASLLKVEGLFSADAVKNNDKELAKAGRKYNHNSKLIQYK